MYWPSCNAWQRSGVKSMLKISVFSILGWLLCGSSASVASEDGVLAIPPASEIKPPAISVSYSRGLLSASAKDANIRALVETIAAKSGVEIVLDKRVNGTVTIEIKEVKFEDGLKNILNGVVAGGYATEYLKKNDDKGQVALRKVTIARVGKKATELKDMLYISDITVQDAIGKEVVFAKWGDGAGEIPLMVNDIDGRTVRVGFYMLRVGEDGALYFVHLGHNRVYVYDKDGIQKHSISFSGRISNIDVDHEGKIYLIEASEGSQDDIGKVLILDQEGKKIDQITIPRDKALFTGNVVIDDGILKDRTTTGEIYDFRNLLKHQDEHSARERYLGKVDPYTIPIPSDGQSVGDDLIISNVNSLGLQPRSIRTIFPEDWHSGDDGPNVLGVDRNNNIYCLISLRMQPPRRFYNNYGFAVLDPAKETANFFKIRELDSFVYENGGLWGEYKRFDIDPQGNMYHLLTSKEGVHIYKYSLGETK